MKNLFKVSIVALLLTATNAMASNCNMPAKTTWVNGFNSTMELNVDESGLVTGTYLTGIGCGIGVERALVGTCNGDAVSFVVNWEECLSVASWTGIYEDGKITSVWNFLMSDNPQEIHNGADIFTPLGK